MNRQIDSKTNSSDIRVIPKFQEKPDIAKLARALIAIAEKMSKEDKDGK